MNFRILPSKRFRKTAKKYKHGGNRHILDAIAEVTQLLSAHDNRALYVLATRWRDHELKGDKRGIRELHLNKEDLLLYRIYDDASIIELLDIVNHEELRNM